MSCDKPVNYHLKYGDGAPVPRPLPIAVTVAWRDDRGAESWHHFWLLEIHGDLLRMQGRDDPDGTRYTGGALWIHTREIAFLEELAV